MKERKSKRKMIRLKINDVKEFQNFITIIGKFAPQCQLVITKEKCMSFCKNLTEYNSARLDIESNTLIIEQKQKVEKIKLCIRDIQALKSAINTIILVQPEKKQIILNIEQTITPDNQVFGKKINYKGGVKFSILTIDRQIILNYINKGLSTDLQRGKIWKFNIDPRKLDIVQNRTNSIVNISQDVSVYITQSEDKQKVMCNLMAKKTNFNNSICIPIADEYQGNLDSIKEIMDDPCISCSSFRLMNLLRISDKQYLKCSFNNEFKCFIVESEILKDNNTYIKATVLMGIIKGK